jgi:hypothetical protein
MVDDKFIDGFIDGAEEIAPGKNCYVFTFSKPARYVKSTKGIYAPYGSEELKNIIKKIKIDDRILVHWFHDSVMQVIDNVDPRVPVYLHFWGGDFIGNTEEFDNFKYDDLTREYVKKNRPFKLFFWALDALQYLYSPRRFFNILKNVKTLDPDHEISIRKRFLSRLNYFCHWNKLDYDIICKAYGCSPAFMNFFYKIGLKADLNSLRNKRDKKSKTVIWLGNSETETNNHLDAISALTKFKDDNIKIICALTYGDKRYGDFITSQGKKVFTNKWSSLRKFIPSAKFYGMFDKADVAVMYHNRTQAGGSVYGFVIKGKKVYVKKQSTIYKLMKKLGVVVFDANTIKDLTFDEFSRPLTDRQIRSNIRKVSDFFSDEKRLKYMNKLLN